MQEKKQHPPAADTLSAVAQRHRGIKKSPLAGRQKEKTLSENSVSFFECSD
jgi:hypothetical protein